MSEQILENFDILKEGWIDDDCFSHGAKIIDLGGDLPVTYAWHEIDRLINAMAKGMTNLDLPVNSRIGIIGYCSYHYVCASLAIYRARHALVPISYKYPKQQVTDCASQSNIKLMFCDAAFRHLVPESVPSIVFGSEEFYHFLDHDEFIPPPLRPDDHLSLRFTSGSTGRPKCVISTYRARLWTLHSLRTSLWNDHSEVSVITAGPLHHIGPASNVDDVLLCRRSQDLQLVLLPKFDAEKYIRAIDHYRPTLLSMVPSMMNILLQHTDLLAQSNLDSVCRIQLTSEAAPEKTISAAERWFPNANFFQHYGSSEMGGIVFGQHPSQLPRPAGSVGYPRQDIMARINDENLLEIKSPAGFIAYENDPDLYKMAFTEDGYYKTGDLFSTDANGFFYFLGRADDMFKSGGEKIYCAEIEHEINQHHGVIKSVVVPVPDDIKGYKPYAFVQLKPDVQVSSQDIKTFLARKLLPYQIPREIWTIHDIPLADSNKTDKKTLIRLAIDNIKHLKT